MPFIKFRIYVYITFKLNILFNHVIHFFRYNTINATFFYHFKNSKPNGLLTCLDNYFLELLLYLSQKNKDVFTKIISL